MQIEPSVLKIKVRRLRQNHVLVNRLRRDSVLVRSPRCVDDSFQNLLKKFILVAVILAVTALLAFSVAVGVSSKQFKAFLNSQNSSIDPGM